MKPIIIAGPCSAESKTQMLHTAEALSRCGGSIVFRAGLWKPRTRPGGFEGVGAEGLPWLAEVRSAFGMPVATEVATAAHVEAVARYSVDYVWLGARTVTNPFAVQEVADALGRMKAEGYAPTVLVKNPLSPDIDLWVGAIERLRAAGVERLMGVHRGFAHYGASTLRNAPMWNVVFEMRRRMPALPMLCDPSHITGRRDLIEQMSQHALDMGFDGLMIESHIDPSCALSDAAQQLEPAALCHILGRLRVSQQEADHALLSDLRRRIDECDERLLQVLAERMRVSDEIGLFKREHNLTAVQMDRHDKIMKERARRAEEAGLSPDFVKRLMSAIHAESVSRQVDIINRK